MLSLLEVPVAIIHERFGLSRKSATVISLLILALSGSTCALTNSTLANFKPFGMTMFDLFDYVSSNLLLPAGGILISLFIGWVWGPQKLEQALSNQGTLANAGLIRVLFLLLRYVSPVLILLVMLKGLGAF